MRKVVAYAGTRNLYEIMKTAATSLLANNHIDMVYMMIEDDVLPFTLPGNVVTVNVSGQQFFAEDGPNYKCRWSYMSMMRLALTKLLPEEEKVLWLDSDTIVDGDLTELFAMDMTGYYFAGCKECDKSNEQFSYINSGVLMMNLAKIREDNLDDRMIDVLNTQKLECPDQDVINMLAQWRILFIDSKYNVCPFTAETQETVIMHFAARKDFTENPLYRKYTGKPYQIKTLIAVPCMDMVNTQFMCSFVDLEKPEGTVYTVTKNTLIYSARNIIAQNAIKWGFDRVLWLDSDTTFEPDTLLKLADDMNKGIDYISGLYFMRQFPTSPVVYSDIWWNVKDNGWVDTGKEIYTEYPKDTVFEVAGTGFGCVMTSVDLLKKVCDKYGSPFTPLMGMGEDMAFCWRCGQMGVKMYCDSRIKCGHIGSFTFNEDVYQQTLHPNAP